MKATNCYSAKFEEQYEQKPKYPDQYSKHPKHRWNIMNVCGLAHKHPMNNLEDGG